jgi:hypothetical protein
VLAAVGHRMMHADAALEQDPEPAAGITLLKDVSMTFDSMNRALSRHLGDLGIAQSVNQRAVPKSLHGMGKVIPAWPGMEGPCGHRLPLDAP